MDTNMVYVECPHCLIYSMKIDADFNPSDFVTCIVCGTKINLCDARISKVDNSKIIVDSDTDSDDFWNN